MPDDQDDDRELLDLAYPFALGAVSEHERTQITERVASAATPTAQAFVRIVADVQETMARVTAVDTATPPAHLRESLLRAIAQHAQPDVPVGPVRHPARRRRLVTRVALAAAAAVVLVIGGAVAIRSVDRTPAPLSVGQVLAHSDVRTFTTGVAGGTITLRASAEANAVVVAMDDVPPPPQGHVYQMWFVASSGAARSAGTMAADTMPPPGGEVIPALDSAASVAVTVEPGSGSSQPTGTRVVTIPLV